MVLYCLSIPKAVSVYSLSLFGSRRSTFYTLYVPSWLWALTLIFAPIALKFFLSSLYYELDFLPLRFNKVSILASNCFLYYSVAFDWGGTMSSWIFMLNSLICSSVNLSPFGTCIWPCSIFTEFWICKGLIKLLDLSTCSSYVVLICFCLLNYIPIPIDV